MSYFNAKMHRIRFGWCSALDTAGGAHSAPPDSLAEFKGLHTIKYTTIFLQFWLLDKMLVCFLYILL